MDERTQFIAAYLLREDSMSALCRRFGISRKTGYKWRARYEAGGPPALREHSHTPHYQPAALTPGTQRTILSLRAKHPHWGPRKLLAWLHQQKAQPGDRTEGDDEEHERPRPLHQGDGHLEAGRQHEPGRRRADAAQQRVHARQVAEAPVERGEREDHTSGSVSNPVEAASEPRGPS
jgi:hypothetical protein